MKVLQIWYVSLNMPTLQMLFYNIFHIVYCILYLYLHTMNNGKVSQDLLLYHVPIQPWTKRLYHEIFTVCNHEKEAVSRDILLYPAPVYVYYVYVDNYCNITCWLLFQLCFVRVYISLPAKKLIWNSTLYNQPLCSWLYKVKDLVIQPLFHGCIQ